MNQKGESGPIFGFSPDDATRIQKSVRRYEDYYRNPPPPVGRGPSGPAIALVPVTITGGDLAAGSSSAPSHQTVDILSAGPGTAGFTGAGLGSAEMYNPFATAIGNGKFCWATYRNGYLYLVVGDC